MHGRTVPFENYVRSSGDLLQSFTTALFFLRVVLGVVQVAEQVIFLIGVMGFL
jgi:hypothetical protein